MALEYQRYGREKSTLVNSAYLNSGEYRSKFDKIAENKEVARVLYAKAKEMLLHRSGTKIEDMCWVDAATGEVVASIVDETIESGVRYTASVEKRIAERKELIAMHTHPASLPPSAADFNSAYLHGYAIALVLCHDGKIFQYAAGEEINPRINDMYIQRYLKIGCSEYDAQIKALQSIKQSFCIDFWEVLP